MNKRDRDLEFIGGLLAVALVALSNNRSTWAEGFRIVLAIAVCVIMGLQIYRVLRSLTK